MAIPLILCRLKDDHSVVHEIGETALIYFPDWEPVPDEHREKIEARNNMIGPLDPSSDPLAIEEPDEKVAEQKPPAKQKPAPKKSAVTTADKDGE